MKQLSLLATLVAVLAITHGVGSPASAQQFPGGVAIVDLSYIFKHHNRFKGMIEDMRREVQAAEEGWKARRAEVEKMQNDLQLYKKDSPEHKQLETDITKRKVDLNAQMALLKKDFMEREAKIYYTVYQEILDSVKYHADRNRISLVIRFNGDEVTDNDPQEILKQLNKQVVYYNPAIDITPLILADLNRSGQVSPGAARVPAPAAGVPRPPQR